MKSYEEMARQILDDRDRILKKRRERHIRIQRITGGAVCFCMVVTASVFFCKNSDFRRAMQSADVLTDTGTMPAVTTAAVQEKTAEETTALAEMELEAPRTTAPVTTAAQTRPPEKRETTTVTTVVTTAEAVKHTEAAPVVTTASSVHTEEQTETTAQTTEKQTETTVETQPSAGELILKADYNEDGVVDYKEYFILLDYLLSDESSGAAEGEYNIEDAIFLKKFIDSGGGFKPMN